MNSKVSFVTLRIISIMLAMCQAFVIPALLTRILGASTAVEWIYIVGAASALSSVDFGLLALYFVYARRIFAEQANLLDVGRYHRLRRIVMLLSFLGTAALSGWAIVAFQLGLGEGICASVLLAAYGSTLVWNLFRLELFAQDLLLRAEVLEIGRRLGFLFAFFMIFFGGLELVVFFLAIVMVVCISCAYYFRTEPKLKIKNESKASGVPLNIGHPFFSIYFSTVEFLFFFGFYFVAPMLGLHAFTLLFVDFFLRIFRSSSQLGRGLVDIYLPSIKKVGEIWSVPPSTRASIIGISLLSALLGFIAIVTLGEIIFEMVYNTSAKFSGQSLLFLALSISVGYVQGNLGYFLSRVGLFRPLSFVTTIMSLIFWSYVGIRVVAENLNSSDVAAGYFFAFLFASIVYTCIFGSIELLKVRWLERLWRKRP